MSTTNYSNLDAISTDTTGQYSNQQQLSAKCARCREPFARHENMAQTGPGEFWHLKCFVCSHCFRPFGRQLEYYERYGRKYCKQDFLTLFAPCCAKCNQHILLGKCIRAMNKSWHPECFQCEHCQVPLPHHHGFVKSIVNDNYHNHNHNEESLTSIPLPREQALCFGCASAKSTDTTTTVPICFKCRAYIDDEPPLIYDDEAYHAYHFNCHSCGIELKPNARLVNSTDLYCQRCHDTKLDVPICDGCRRPIERERYVTALGKRWHIEHFACAHCERPFNGKRYYEFNGQAYCEADCRQPKTIVSQVSNRNQSSKRRQPICIV